MPAVPQRCFEDAAVGQELAPCEIRLTHTLMVAQVAGSQDWSKVHHDPGVAVRSGQTDIFYNTGWTHAFLMRLLTDWAGPLGWVSKLSFEMRRMNGNGDTVRARGRVLALRPAPEGGGAVELEVWLESDRQGVTTPAKAEVRLPARAGLPGAQAA